MNLEEESNHKILIVDDEEEMRKAMSMMLESYGYGFDTAENGFEALEKARRDPPPDLIYLDIQMPQMNGLDACRKIKEDPSTNHIPVVMITASTDRESRMKGLEAGANDFLTKPIDASELMLRTKNLLKVKDFEDFIVMHNQLLSNQVDEKTKELRLSYIDTIYRLTMAAEFKDQETASHIRRMSLYMEQLSNVLKSSNGDAEILSYAAPMHDIGKIGIPDIILLKPGRLSREEFEIVKTHTTIGGQMLKNSTSPILRKAEIIALCHHERWDGTGYPLGLKGKEIPFEGRLLNIIDQYDALRMNRPYKPPLDHGKAVHIIAKGDDRTRPSHFDPMVLTAFLDTHKEFREIFDANKD